MEKETDERNFFKTEVFMIFAIVHQLDLYRNKILEPYGITGKQAVILSFLLRNPDKQLTQRDFEYQFNLCSSTINSVLNNLEKGGFLQRSISQTDGRAKNVTATEKSQRAWAAIIELFRKETAWITKGFTQEEQEQFRNYLFRVFDNIKGNDQE